MKRRAFVLLVALACAGCDRKKNPNVLEGGDIKYAVNGMERGTVGYAPGVRRQDAGAVGDWLKDKGWFVTRPENKSLISGKALGAWGTGAAGRGISGPMARVALRGQGLDAQKMALNDTCCST